MILIDSRQVADALASTRKGWAREGESDANRRRRAVAWAKRQGLKPIRGEHGLMYWRHAEVWARLDKHRQ